MNKLLSILLLLTGLYSTPSLATGPSYVLSEIRPISMNEKGEILCKTRFEENPMGSHGPVGVAYGFCVLQKGSIQLFPGKRLGYDLEEKVYWEQLEYWDQIFETPANSKQLATIVEEVLNNKYSFANCNAQEFYVGTTLAKNKFETAHSVNLDQTKQQTFDGTKSRAYYQENQVTLLYDFGHTLLLHNSSEAFNEPSSPANTGAEFAYEHHHYPTESEEGIPYDESEITGILFREE